MLTTLLFVLEIKFFRENWKYGIGNLMDSLL